MSEYGSQLKPFETSRAVGFIRRVGDLIIQISQDFPISSNIIGADLSDLDTAGGHVITERYIQKHAKDGIEVTARYLDFRFYYPES